MLYLLSYKRLFAIHFVNYFNIARTNFNVNSFVNIFLQFFSWTAFRCYCLYCFVDLINQSIFVILRMTGADIQREGCFKALCIRFSQNRLPTVMEGLAMENYIYCCGFRQICRVYNLPNKHFSWKRLYFIDECKVCKKSIAIIKVCTSSGTVKTLKRCSGKRAVKLRDKLTFKERCFPDCEKGTLENSRCFYNNAGVIYNFNNKRVGTNDEFCNRVKELV